MERIPEVIKKKSTAESKKIQDKDLLVINHKWDKILKEHTPNVENCIKMLEGCDHCSSSLINLINDLLDLAKQEQKTFQFNKKYFDVIQTVK